MSNDSVVVLSAVRTPVGSFRGCLSKKTATELGAITIQQAIKAASLVPSDIGEVYMGHVLQAGCRQSTARQAAINAGCPFSVDCTTINKVCSSSLKAVTLAAQSILSKNEKFVVAGGMESMSNAPFLISREAPTYGGIMMQDSITYDGLTCAFNDIHMGECTEKLAKKYGISREEQDEYAINSYKLATEAWKDHVFDDEIVYVPIQDKNSGNVVKIFEDEEYKKIKFEKVPHLKPAFAKDGTITAANASKLNDGASSLVLSSMSEAVSKAVEPIAKLVAFADAACEPVNFGIAPVHAIIKALAKTTISLKDVAQFEINEAFSAVPLACIKELGIDPAKVNIHGGAVALGHPVGASGARILTHLVHSLEPHQVGVAAICNGGGGATAVVVIKLRP